MKRSYKTIAALLMSALLLLAPAACSTTNGGTQGAATDAPAGAPTSEPAVLKPADPTAEPAAAATGDPSGTADDPAETADDPSAGVVNPRTDYASVAELNAALGFEVCELDAESGFTAKSFTAIDGTIGEIVYHNEAGAELCLRTAAGAEDPSGVDGAALADKSTEQVQIQSGALDDLLVAWLTNGTATCSLTAEGVSRETFDHLVGQLTSLLSEAK